MTQQNSDNLQKSVDLTSESKSLRLASSALPCLMGLTILAVSFSACTNKQDDSFDSSQQWELPSMYFLLLPSGMDMLAADSIALSSAGVPFTCDVPEFTYQFLYGIGQVATVVIEPSVYIVDSVTFGALNAPEQNQQALISTSTAKIEAHLSLLFGKTGICDGLFRAKGLKSTFPFSYYPQGGAVFSVFGLHDYEWISPNLDLYACPEFSKLPPSIEKIILGKLAGLVSTQIKSELPFVLDSLLLRSLSFQALLGSAYGFIKIDNPSSEILFGVMQLGPYVGYSSKLVLQATSCKIGGVDSCQFLSPPPQVALDKKAESLLETTGGYCATIIPREAMQFAMQVAYYSGLLYAGSTRIPGFPCSQNGSKSCSGLRIGALSKPELALKTDNGILHATLCSDQVSVELYASGTGFPVMFARFSGKTCLEVHLSKATGCFELDNVQTVSVSRIAGSDEAIFPVAQLRELLSPRLSTLCIPQCPWGSFKAKELKTLLTDKFLILYR